MPKSAPFPSISASNANFTNSLVAGIIKAGDGGSCARARDGVGGNDSSNGAPYNGTSGDYNTAGTDADGKPIYFGGDKGSQGNVYYFGAKEIGNTEEDITNESKVIESNDGKQGSRGNDGWGGLYLNLLQTSLNGIYRLRESPLYLIESQIFYRNGTRNRTGGTAVYYSVGAAIVLGASSDNFFAYADRNSLEIYIGKTKNGKNYSFSGQNQVSGGGVYVRRIGSIENQAFSGWPTNRYNIAIDYIEVFDDSYVQAEVF